MSKLEVATVPLPSELKPVKTAAPLKGSLVMGCMTGLLSFGFLVILLGLVGIPNADLVALLIGLVVTVFAAISMFRFEQGDLKKTNTDIASGKCLRIEVAARSSRRQFLGRDIEAILFDCGDKCLLVWGGWWRDRAEIVWRGRHFPAASFTLYVGRESGKVLMAECPGPKQAPADYLPAELFVARKINPHHDVLVLDQGFAEVPFSEKTSVRAID